MTKTEIRQSNFSRISVYLLLFGPSIPCLLILGIYLYLSLFSLIYLCLTELLVSEASCCIIGIHLREDIIIGYC